MEKIIKNVFVAIFAIAVATWIIPSTQLPSGIRFLRQEIAVILGLPESLAFVGLNEAVNSLASRLTTDGRIIRKPVLVNVHNFYEEGSGRNLPLSATLRERFGTELSARGVTVYALPEGSEDEMVVLQGVWSELAGTRVEYGEDWTKTVHLTVRLMERTDGGGYQVVGSAGGRVEEVARSYLTPDLASSGRHMVKELENRMRDRSRRVVGIGKISITGGSSVGSDVLRKYLERRWLRPALAESRLLRLVGASTGDRQIDSVLHVDLFADSEHVEIVVNVDDKKTGRQVTAAAVQVAKKLFPAGYFSE